MARHLLGLAVFVRVGDAVKFGTLAIVTLLTACGSNAPSPLPSMVTLPPSSSQPPAAQPNVPGDPGPTLDARRAALAKPLVVAYAQRLAPMVAGRSLNQSELATLEANGGPALPEVLSGWTSEVGFSSMARDWISTKLKASGKRDGVNLNLPGNLAAHLAKNRRPHAELLTADYCVDDGGTKTSCDTGAPFTAGVLTTRAFLANNTSRYNLKRARSVLRGFGCADYPLDEAVQPRLERAVLIPLFKQDQKESTDVGTFGNGFACYTCHGQFGAHAQPFVKFDSAGKYVEGATGLQDPTREQGLSTGTLAASHLIEPDAARNEASQVFGKPVANLKGLAEAYVGDPAFLRCSVSSLLGYAFGLAESTVFMLPVDVVKDVVIAAERVEPAPSTARLAIEAFSHPAVVNSFSSP